MAWERVHRLRKAPKMVNKAVLMNGGATSPTIEMYQLESGRCRLFWYCFDQEGSTQESIKVFHEKDWQKALERGRKEAVAYVKQCRDMFAPA